MTAQGPQDKGQSQFPLSDGRGNRTDDSTDSADHHSPNGQRQAQPPAFSPRPLNGAGRNGSAGPGDASEQPTTRIVRVPRNNARKKPHTDASEQPTVRIARQPRHNEHLQPHDDSNVWPTAPLSGFNEWMTNPRMPVMPRPPAPQRQDGAPAQSGTDEYADLAGDLATTWILPIVAPSPLLKTTTRMAAIVPGGEGYVAMLQTLAKSSGIYALASLVSPLVSLVLAPYLAHNLSSSDYGGLAILTTLIGLLAGLSQLGLGSAFFRAYNYDFTSPKDQQYIPWTITALLCLLTIPTAAAIFFGAPFISILLFGRDSFAGPIAIAALVVLLQNLTVPGFAWLRAESRALAFSLLSIGNVVTNLIANIVLVGFLHLGVGGSLLATGSGFAVVVAFSIPMVFFRAQHGFRFDIAWSVITYGAPQVLSLISVWVLGLSDRYLLAAFTSLGEAARYSVAYSLGSVLSTLVIAPFALAWPTTMFAFAKRKDAARLFAQVFRWYSLLLLFAAFGVTIVSTQLLSWLFPPSYLAAAPVIPVVAASLVFYGIYILCMTGSSLRRKTWMAGAFTGVAAIVNVGMNLVLIPRFHAMGAAISTLVAYIVLAAIAYIANRVIYPVPYEFGRFINAALTGVGIYIWCIILAHLVGNQWTLPIDAVGLIAYAVWLLHLGAPREARKVVLRQINSKLPRRKRDK